MLNRMLGHSLDPDTMKLLSSAEKAGIPFFVNPYYLSLLHVRVPYFAIGADQAIRNYVIYSPQLVEEFGHIVAWEKEVNLPGVGKSQTVRVIGITRYGRRILEFDHDATRVHSPIIHKMGKVIIIESKSIGEYLKQLEEMGEDISEYESLYGYSMGETEARMEIYEYPKYSFTVSEELTNLEIPNE